MLKLGREGDSGYSMLDTRYSIRSPTLVGILIRLYRVSRIENRASTPIGRSKSLVFCPLNDLFLQLMGDMSQK